MHTQNARRYGARTLAAAAGMSLFALLGVTPAMAQAAVPQSCPPDPGYAYSGVSSHNVGMVPPASAPGGHTLSIAITAGTSVTGTVGGSVSGDVHAIVAGAKAQVNASIALTLSASVTYTDSWKVPASWRLGYLHAGAHRDQMTWKYGHYLANCSWHTDRSGTAKLPYHIPSFWSTKG
ncbi:hypothetical protein OG762_14480 [Streptomyces sp. NBC_01136]|uniref:hypothetical protein n=1 Tax=unclassified Streptomyces TaxID=2593676 RepID=UPI00324B9F01|nr:hypothetical protein OG762_14480 [Streptomyces sp. NBC_01136]